jgi:hypothetical protein
LARFFMAIQLIVGQGVTHNRIFLRKCARWSIVALLQEHPEGLMPAEIRDLLGVERRLADTCLGMLRYGLVQRVGRGTYVVAEPSRHDAP